MGFAVDRMTRGKTINLARKIKGLRGFLGNKMVLRVGDTSPK